MTSQTTGTHGGRTDFSLDSLDADTADCIGRHLDEALAADDADAKDFHVRHAQQLLDAATDS
ncbi:MAG: hypothetical protein ABEJ85_03060 [Haloarculaceae archaeon]